MRHVEYTRTKAALCLIGMWVLCALTPGISKADPVPYIITLFGGADTERGCAVAVAADGGIVIAGTTRSNDLPTTSGAYDETHNGGSDMYVAKINSELKELEWCTYIGGSGGDTAYDMVMGDNGKIVICGHTTSTNMPVSPTAPYPAYSGGYDAYIAVLSSDGSTLEYGTYMGGWTYDYAEALAVSGEYVVVAGHTRSIDFPTTEGVYMEYMDSIEGDDTVFVSVMNMAEMELVATTFLTPYTVSPSLCIDSFGRIVITCATWSEFPTTEGAYDMTYNGGNDVVVLAMDMALQSVIWGTYVGSPGYDAAISLVPVQGGVIIYGLTDSDEYPVTGGSYDVHHDGMRDAFVSKLSAAGESMIWSTYFGGSGDEDTFIYNHHSIVLDSAENAVIVGDTSSTDIMMTDDAIQSEYIAWDDAYIAVISNDGTELLYGTYLGGSLPDAAWGVAITDDGKVVVVGQTISEDFPVTPGAYDESLSPGHSDAYIAVLDISQIVPTMIQYFDVNPSGDDVRISWLLYDDGACEVKLTSGSGADERLIDFDCNEAGCHAIDHPRGHSGDTVTYDLWCRCNGEDWHLLATKDLQYTPARPTATILSASPNPFNPALTIGFHLPQPGRVEIELLDLAGRRVAVIVRGDYPAGAHAVTWGRAADETVPSGSYLIRLRTGEDVDTHKVSIVK